MWQTTKLEVASRRATQRRGSNPSHYCENHMSSGKVTRHGHRNLKWSTIMTRNIQTAVALIALATIAVYPGHARAEISAELDCNLKFSLSTWSVIYKHSEGK